MKSTGLDSGAPHVLDSIAALVASVRRQHHPGQRRLVGLVGAPGAGKSHLAGFLRDAVGADTVAIAAMDGFHLANEVLEAGGLRQYKGRPDTFDVAGLVSVLDRLRAPGGTVYLPRFVREIEEPIAGAVAIGADVDLVLVEGNYLLVDTPPWDAVAARLDVSYYLDTPEDVRRQRLASRARRTYGVARGRRWVERVDIPNAAIVEATKGRADHFVRHVDVAPATP